MTNEEKREKFVKATGEEPENDDLERAFCDKPGQPGHCYCGWCKKCDEPRFKCACYMSGN